MMKTQQSQLENVRKKVHVRRVRKKGLKVSTGKECSLALVVSTGPAKSDRAEETEKVFRVKGKKITRKDLLDRKHMTREQAASDFNLCIASLRKARQFFGYAKWPPEEIDNNVSSANVNDKEDEIVKKKRKKGMERSAQEFDCSVPVVKKNKLNVLDESSALSVISPGPEKSSGAEETEKVFIVKDKKITRKDLLDRKHMTRDQAADDFNFSVASLRKARMFFGYEKWPPEDTDNNASFACDTEDVNDKKDIVTKKSKEVTEDNASACDVENVKDKKRKKGN